MSLESSKRNYLLLSLPLSLWVLDVHSSTKLSCAPAANNLSSFYLQ